MFVRLMRDKGFDFYWTDQFTQNLFAQGFEGCTSGSYELVTAFEVFEHLPNPVEEIEKMLIYSKNILFSTLLLPEKKPSLEQWWYFALEGGQHISLYSRESLQSLANRFGLFLFSDGYLLHLFTTKKLSKWLFPLVLEGRYWFFVSRFLRKRKSLLEDDFLKITRKRHRDPSPHFLEKRVGRKDGL